MAGCERSIIHSFGAILWGFYDLGFTVVKLAYDTWGAVNRVAHAGTQTIVKPLDAKYRVLINKVNGSVGALIHVTIPHLTHEIATEGARIGHLAARVAHLTAALGADVATLPARVGITPKQLRRLLRRTSALEKATVGLGAAALVATALHRLGYDWIKCDAAKGLFKKRKCNLWNGLDDLLSMAIDLVVVTHICDVFPLLEDGFKYVAAPMIGTLAAAGAGVCDASYAATAPLDVPQLYGPSAADVGIPPGV